jgi:hypothetical protein
MAVRPWCDPARLASSLERRGPFLFLFDEGCALREPMRYVLFGLRSLVRRRPSPRRAGDAQVWELVDYVV